jgi:antitoxin MazE
MLRMAIRQRIVKIGSSRGVRLPASMLAEVHLAEGDEVEVSAEVGRIVLCPIREPRAGWAEQVAEMARQGDDALLDAEYLTPSEWDQKEWEW